ncbi:class I SAM-dependent methyltransferase [Tsukamurella sp. PLM1]|uniref:class I SAM-dependent methyltransferase n=1 Tax=Tsukamurella sp. PLM1 TaxID=2929795 RepID=UPI00206A92C3|nr:methyltransferase domain-containing protein [Tsukamurella sp. PLM1]BDH58217.1 methyltransferase [Tsukamurella sp. PLM1]
MSNGRRPRRPGIGGARIEEWLGESTVRMLDDAGVTAGSHVIDIAAGAGGQTVAAARRAGSSGWVLATDISPAILDFATRSAAAAGLTNVETLEADGEDLRAIPDATYDAAISRVGLIYFPDRGQALAEMHRVLRPGGRASAVVYAAAERNGFFAVPVGIIGAAAGLPAPAPGLPGPFSLAGDGVATAAFTAAGFVDVTATAVPSPVRFSSSAECTRFERESFGALHQMLAGVDESTRTQTWERIEHALGEYDGPTGFVGPCEMLVVSGIRP